MARQRRLFKISFGVFIGLMISRFIPSFDMICTERDRITPLRIIDKENERAFNKNLLFVGVMTAAKYLDTRAKAVYQTWGKQVPGKIMFYSSEVSYSEHVPLIALEGVDDDYPPQKKSFRMLKHIYDNYIDQYEWFLRADDDIYIRTDRLEDLLRSVDSRKSWFIGQTGRGTNEEIGLLSLDNDENFCMGGPGVIFSRETLRKIAPHLNECYGNLLTIHEDVEVGRCVRKFAGISCTWSYEMQIILYHNQSGEAAFTGELKSKEVHRAITLHPVKKSQVMLKLHKYLKGLVIQSEHQKSISLHRGIGSSTIELNRRVNSFHSSSVVDDIFNLQMRASSGYLGDTRILGVPISLTRYTPTTLLNLQEWKIISRSLYSVDDVNPRKRIGSSLKEGLSDMMREVMELINSFSKQRGRIIDFKELLYGYYRTDALHGVDWILDLLLVYQKYRGHKMTVQVRRHAYFQQTFTGIFVQELESRKSPVDFKISSSLPVHKNLMNQIFSKISEKFKPIISTSYDYSKTCVNFILPLSGRYNVFVRFLNMYESVCLKNYDVTKLYVILYRCEKSPTDFQMTIKLIKQFNAKYRNSIKVFQSNETFSRGKALQMGVDHLQNNDLILFIDVDIIFNNNAVNSVRRNTVLNSKIFFPIVYSLFNPKLVNKAGINIDYSNISLEIMDNYNGFWRQFGFGIVSLYKDDYIKLGGFNLLISGWGYEDVKLYDNVIKSQLDIVRSVDSGFLHVYHSIDCEEHLDKDQSNMCEGTRATTLGSLKQLQQIFMKNRHLFR